MRSKRSYETLGGRAAGQDRTLPLELGTDKLAQMVYFQDSQIGNNSSNQECGCSYAAAPCASGTRSVPVVHANHRAAVPRRLPETFLSRPERRVTADPRLLSANRCAKSLRVGPFQYF